MTFTASLKTKNNKSSVKSQNLGLKTTHCKTVIQCTCFVVVQPSGTKKLNAVALQQILPHPRYENHFQSHNVQGWCSVLFLSCRWSEGWPHHERTFSIYLYPRPQISPFKTAMDKKQKSSAKFKTQRTARDRVSVSIPKFCIIYSFGVDRWGLKW